MGYLHYSGMESFAFDDRLLTHLRTVVLGKLKRQESLILTWTRDGQQHSIWLHPTVPIHFEFEAETTEELNPLWIEQLASLANSPGGLRCVEEPPRKA